MHLNIDRTYLQLGRRLMPRILFVSVLSLVSLVAVIVSLGWFAIDAAAATPPPITVTEQDSDRTIEVAVGQKIFVQLPSNPTTGYQWNVLGGTAPLEFVKSGYATDPPAAVRAGAGGTQTLQFTAKAPGKGELKLGYARPWEKDVPPAKTFSATIVVR